MSLRKNLHLAYFRLQIAEDDMKAACALLQAGLPAHACSAAQQCGVNAVESLWYLAGIDPWIKPIVGLVARLPQRDDISAFAVWMEKAAGLEEYDNGFRHSSGLSDLIPRRVYRSVEAQDAIEMARFFLDAAKGIVAVEEAKQVDSDNRDMTNVFGPYINSLTRIGFWLGQLELVIHLLTRRFGAVPYNLEARVRTVPGEHMLDLLDASLAAASLDEVLAIVHTLVPERREDGLDK